MGLPCFRNICLSLLQNYIINVKSIPDVLADVKRARERIVAMKSVDFDVLYKDRTSEYVKAGCVRHRVQLPWLSEDLRKNFLILRRRFGSTKQHIEKDLRVRCKSLKRTLPSSTRRRVCRPGWGEETMHVYCAACNMRDEHEMELGLPRRRCIGAVYFFTISSRARHRDGASLWSFSRLAGRG